jgi:hypothetical protein
MSDFKSKLEGINRDLFMKRFRSGTGRNKSPAIKAYSTSKTPEEVLDRMDNDKTLSNIEYNQLEWIVTNCINNASRQATAKKEKIEVSDFKAKLQDINRELFMKRFRSRTGRNKSPAIKAYYTLKTPEEVLARMDEGKDTLSNIEYNKLVRIVRNCIHDASSQVTTLPVWTGPCPPAKKEKIEVTELDKQVWMEGCRKAIEEATDRDAMGDAVLGFVVSQLTKH